MIKKSTGKKSRHPAYKFDRTIKPLTPAQLAKLPGRAAIMRGATDESGYVAPPKQVPTKKTVAQKKAFVKKKAKEHYTLRQLPIPKQKNFVKYVEYIENHSDELNGLLNKGEYWAASYFGNKTHDLYPDIGKLMLALNKYRDSEKFGKRTKLNALIRKIQIFKFKGSTGKKGVKAHREYKKVKQEEVDARMEVQNNIIAKDRAKRRIAEKKLMMTQKQLKKYREKTSKIVAGNRKMDAANKKMKKEIKRLKAEVKRYEAKRTKVTHTAKKKAPKKGTAKPKTKKTVAPKKQVKKSKTVPKLSKKKVKKSKRSAKPSKKGKRK